MILYKVELEVVCDYEQQLHSVDFFDSKEKAEKEFRKHKDTVLGIYDKKDFKTVEEREDFFSMYNDDYSLEHITLDIHKGELK